MFWHNKIKGSIGESACQAHFELMGFVVEPFGVEHAAPKVLQAIAPGELPDSLRFLPDYLTVRSQCGSTRLLAIESKFRTDICLDEFAKKLIEQYKRQISQFGAARWVFYLVANGYRASAGSTLIPGVHVFMMSPANKQWWHVERDASKFLGSNVQELYAPGPRTGIKGVTESYRETIKPALESVFFDAEAKLRSRIAGVIAT